MAEPRQALVLSGGGASGAYGVGALRCLLSGASPATDQRPIDPAILTGTSIGSFNASYLVSQWSGDWSVAADRLRDVWLERLAVAPGRRGAFRLRGNPIDVLHPRWWLPNPLAPIGMLAGDLLALGRHGARRIGRLLKSRKAAAERLMELADATGLLALDAWQNILRETIDYQTIRRSAKALRVTATNWSDGSLRLFSNAEMSDDLGPRAIAASCAVPGFLPPVKVGDEYFIDGSMRMYSPLLPAIQAGGQVLHLIYMNVDVGSEPVDGQENSIETLFRSLVMFWAAAVERDVRRVDSYNRMLRLVNRLTGSRNPQEKLSEQEIEILIESVGPDWNQGGAAVGYGPLTVHRYFPRTGFEGTLSFTDMNRDRLARMVEQGYEETLRHDCNVCGCVLPDSDQHRETQESLEFLPWQIKSATTS